MARTSKSEKAGLKFPVGRMYRFLKQGKYAKRVGQVGTKHRGMWHMQHMFDHTASHTKV